MPEPTIPPARYRSRGDQTWRHQAACRPTEYHPVDPDMFFPEPDEMDKIHAAKALCAQCPVRATCLDAALDNRDAHGIRGGLTEQERHPLHKNLPLRLDYSRVNAALAGQDPYLTHPERRALALIAHEQDVSEERLARLLRITPQYAKRLYREARQALEHRAAHQTLPPDQYGTTPPSGDTNSPQNGTQPGDSGPQLGRNDFGTAA